MIATSCFSCIYRAEISSRLAREERRRDSQPSFNSPYISSRYRSSTSIFNNYHGPIVACLSVISYLSQNFTLISVLLTCLIIVVLVLVVSHLSITANAYS
ncbi:hypothetical protein V1527DRAFT_93372 [Lipomyces starkeyi]